MKKNLRKISEWILPPKIKEIINKMRGNNWYFTGSFKEWTELEKITTGYDNEEILKRVLESIIKVKEGREVFERDSVIFSEIQYSWPLLSALMWAAARKNGELRLIDYGGSLGSTYFQNLKFLKYLNKISWNIVEQEKFVEAGKKHIQNEELRFYKSIEECFDKNHINVALFSAVLDVIKEPIQIIKNVIEKNVETIIIDRSVFLNESYDIGEDKLVLQVVPKNIYSAKLPFRLLSYKKIRELLILNEYEILETFSSIGQKTEEWEFKGLIATKRKCEEKNERNK